MCPETAVCTSYRVEISGWDVDENFFVEKTELDWSEENGNRVYLRRALRERAVVFIRLIAPTAAGHSLPIAYQAEKVQQAKANGMWEVQLVQLHPRAGAQAPRGHSPTHPPETK